MALINARSVVKTFINGFYVTHGLDFLFTTETWCWYELSCWTLIPRCIL